MEVGTTLLGTIKEAIKRGRITVIEFMFMEGLVAAGVKKSKDAKTFVDNAVTQMDGAELVQDDIDATIWNFGAMVLQGKPLQ